MKLSNFAVTYPTSDDRDRVGGGSEAGVAYV